MFQGSIVALVTPMNKDGSLDIKSFNNLLDFHVQNKSDGVVVVGTSGEAPTIDFDEHISLINKAVKFIRGRIPVIAGTGANSTKEAIFLTQEAKNAGVDGSLLVTPYYNKPSQKGLYEHYKAINDAVDIPQVLYNVPARTSCDLENDTVIKLSYLPNIVGIKDATGDLTRIENLKNKVADNFIFISGDDITFLDYLKKGGKAVISVTANVRPLMMHEICNLVKENKIEDAEKLNQKLELLHKAMFIESNPIPVKWMLTKMGLIQQYIRLPLVELDPSNTKILNEGYKLSE
ncbi:4-hydroxy-tetrahydrodipicolinate synthase [Methylophilaceae bacterium]|nr:4-hydroxy-tetrahydrodipicolinate synthase [Methylophilaceae bacterium]|tara:strand:+ start:781 stop:1650 length:870 start_codon:yes stop_codon:yes gene_type:complete